MSDAIQIVCFTEDGLIIDASLQMYNGNMFSFFAIGDTFDEEEGKPSPAHVFDVNNPKDPVFEKIDEIVTRRLKEDAIYFRNEFERLGIKFKTTEKNPLLIQ